MSGVPVNSLSEFRGLVSSEDAMFGDTINTVFKALKTHKTDKVYDGWRNALVLHDITNFIFIASTLKMIFLLITML